VFSVTSQSLPARCIVRDERTMSVIFVAADSRHSLFWREGEDFNILSVQTQSSKR